MKNISLVYTRKWIIVGLLLLMMGITPVVNAQAADLTATEKYWLTYLREEEKLTRDVYLYYYDIWGSRIFKKISTSEQRHMDAIKNLLDRYGLPDPAAGNGQGEFTNPILQELYNDLIKRGGTSLVEALNVGVFIEETDIDDLNEGIATTRRRDIKKVYSNLLQGSLNHLDACIANLASLGIVYKP